METNKFNFKSQPCTSREQSERLLALGLKKETADCVLPKKDYLPPLVMPYDKASIYTTIEIIPAWSLGRLVEIINKCNFESFESETWRKETKKFCRYVLVSHSDDLIENSVEIIETLIEKGHFNKEYLV
jgi:hypothetical protein